MRGLFFHSSLCPTSPSARQPPCLNFTRVIFYTTTRGSPDLYIHVTWHQREIRTLSQRLTFGEDRLETHKILLTGNFWTIFLCTMGGKKNAPESVFGRDSGDKSIFTRRLHVERLL